MNTESRGSFCGAKSRAAVAVLALFILLPLPSSADGDRQQRLFREEDPLWRRVLALPADLLELTTWPLRQTLYWMERQDVPERIEDGVMYPVRHLRGERAEEDE